MHAWLLFFGIIILVCILLLVPNQATTTVENRQMDADEIYGENEKKPADPPVLHIAVTPIESIDPISLVVSVPMAHFVPVYAGSFQNLSIAGSFILLSSAADVYGRIELLKWGSAAPRSISLQALSTPFSKAGQAMTSNLILAPHFRGKKNQLLGAVFELSDLDTDRPQVRRFLIGPDDKFLVKPEMVASAEFVMICKTKGHEHRVDIFSRTPTWKFVQSLEGGNKLAISGNGRVVALMNEFSVTRYELQEATWVKQDRFQIESRDGGGGEIFLNFAGDEMVMTSAKTGQLIRKTQTGNAETWPITAISCLFDRQDRLWVLEKSRLVLLDSDRKEWQLSIEMGPDCKLYQMADVFIVADLQTGTIYRLDDVRD